MGCNGSTQRCDTKMRNEPHKWCNYSDYCKDYRCDKGLVPSSRNWCRQREKLIAARLRTSIYASQASQARIAKLRAEEKAREAEAAKQKSEIARKAAEAEAAINRKILLKKTNKEQEALREAKEAAELAKRQLNAKRYQSKRLRELNACNQDDIDNIRIKQLEIQKEKELEAAVAAAEAELKLAEEKKAKADEELRLKQEEMEKRINFSQTAKMKISFNKVPVKETPVLPVQIECFTNPDNMANCTDETINNIYTNHYEHNLKTYMQNKIVIDEMTDKINNINSRLQYKMNKNINYGPDGQLTFY